jgi:hypothetical protein
MFEMFTDLLFRPGGYRPSGRCDWFTLLAIALPLTLLGACVLAFVLSQVFLWHCYYPLIVPLAAGGILGWLAWRLFRFARCRNPWVAGGFGVLLGSLMFLGYFHCHYVTQAGLPELTRVDALPAFINFRMHHDVIYTTHSVIGEHSREPDVFTNWIAFAFDWAMAAGICGLAAFYGARRAFCETCSRWLLSKTATVAPGLAGEVIAAVSAKQIASLPVIPAVKTKHGSPSAQFELEYCPGNAVGEKYQADACPIYLTAWEVTPGNKNNHYVARQIPLNAEELAELSQKLSFQ